MGMIWLASVQTRNYFGFWRKNEENSEVLMLMLSKEYMLKFSSCWIARKKKKKKRKKKATKEELMLEGEKICIDMKSKIDGCVIVLYKCDFDRWKRAFEDYDWEK